MRSSNRKDPTPSVHSISSSEVSSASTSSIHKRSTPKIAAIIIVAFLIIASLAGVTVYFITSEKLLMKTSVSQVHEKRIDSTFSTNFYEPNQNNHQLNEKHAEYEEYPEEYPEKGYETGMNDYSVNDYNGNEYTGNDYSGSLPSVPPEEKIEPQNSNLEQTPYVRSQGAYYRGRLGLPSPVFNVHTRKIHPGPRFRNEMVKPKHFREGQDPEGPPYIQYEEILPTKESNALLGGVLSVDENRADIPAKQDRNPETLYDYDDLDENMLLNLEGIGVFGTDFSKKVEEEITEEPKVVLDVDNPEQQEVQQRFFESGMRAQEQGSYFQRNQPIRRRFRPRLNYGGIRRNNIYPSESAENLQQYAETSPNLPDNPNIPNVPQTQNGQNGRKGATLATLDRRPNRPPFHHMGPLPASRRGGPPYINYQPQQLGKRMGVLANMQEMITLAKNEIAVLRDLAKNITDSGKELNLWEVLDAVNSTVADNPNSGMAKLMRRFYSSYLSEDTDAQLSDLPVPGTYEKSLSSLIFLSFGIFLLNSVNEHLTSSAVENLSSEGRSMQGHSALEQLFSEHQTLSKLFRGRSLDDPAGDSISINNYLKLLMNLMNIYNSEEKERDVDCVWRLYCHVLNKQAEIGGMASTVAKINSVGMKLVLEELPGDSAVPAVFQSMVNWKPLHCANMFPKCVQ